MDRLTRVIRFVGYAMLVWLVGWLGCFVMVWVLVGIIVGITIAVLSFLGIPWEEGPYYPF